LKGANTYTHKYIYTQIHIHTNTYTHKYMTTHVPGLHGTGISKKKVAGLK